MVPWPFFIVRNGAKSTASIRFRAPTMLSTSCLLFLTSERHLSAACSSSIPKKDCPCPSLPLHAKVAGHDVVVLPIPAGLEYYWREKKALLLRNRLGAWFCAAGGKRKIPQHRLPQSPLHRVIETKKRDPSASGVKTGIPTLPQRERSAHNSYRCARCAQRCGSARQLARHLHPLDVRPAPIRMRQYFMHYKNV